MKNEIQNSVEKTILYGKKAAIISFLIGSIILLIYYLSHFNSIIYFALFYCTAAILINGFIFIQLAIEFFKKNLQQKKILQTVFLMLLNIPIGILYFEIGFHIYSSVTPN